MCTLLSVKLEKPEIIALLIEVLEEGDELKMVFIPGDESGVGEYVDRLSPMIDEAQSINSSD